MEAKGLGPAVKGGQSGGKPTGGSFLARAGDTPFSGKCHNCNEVGHKRRNCPKPLQGNPQGNQGGKGKFQGRKGKTQPKHRKFNCAYCRDNTKYCFTAWCEALKKLDFTQRKQLLDTNKDCPECAGDCPAGNCTRKTKKVCGQGVVGPGCGQAHVLNELF